MSYANLADFDARADRRWVLYLQTETRQSVRFVRDLHRDLGRTPGRFRNHENPLAAHAFETLRRDPFLRECSDHVLFEAIARELSSKGVT